MTDSTDELDKAQKNQKEAGSAESDPETDGPAENLREEASKVVDNDEDSSEPA